MDVLFAFLFARGESCAHQQFCFKGSCWSAAALINSRAHQQFCFKGSCWSINSNWFTTVVPQKNQWFTTADQSDKKYVRTYVRTYVRRFKPTSLRSLIAVRPRFPSHKKYNFEDIPTLFVLLSRGAQRKCFSGIIFGSMTEQHVTSGVSWSVLSEKFGIMIKQNVISGVLH